MDVMVVVTLISAHDANMRGRGTVVWGLIQLVLPPLVSQLTEGFMDRRRDGVTVDELQRRVIDILVNQRAMEYEMTDMRMTVLALTRYLANSQRDTFVLYGDDRLELAVGSQPPRAAEISQALAEFQETMEELVRRRAGGSVGPRADGARHSPVGSRQQERAPLAPAVPVPRRYARSAEAEPLEVTPEALSSFFDGFDEEIMRARLGRDAPNE